MRPPASVVCRNGLAVLFSLVIPALLPGCRRTEEPPAVQTQAPAEPPSITLTEPAAVFAKAFWKRPSAGDHILHAERREWKDGNAILKWQWFISLEPSPELLKYLREDNAFRLSPASSAPVIADAPAWFAIAPADVEILSAPGGNMQLMFHKSKRLLLATDSGGGFRPGEPEGNNPPPATQPVSNGRLPQTPPPNPTTP